MMPPGAPEACNIGRIAARGRDERFLGDAGDGKVVDEDAILRSIEVVVAKLCPAALADFEFFADEVRAREPHAGQKS